MEKGTLGGRIAKNSILMVTQPYTYKHDPGKLAEAKGFTEKLKKKGAIVALVSYPETPWDVQRETEIYESFRKHADYLLKVTGPRLRDLEHGQKGKEQECERFEKNSDLYKRVTAILENIALSEKRNTLIIMGGHDSYCVREYTKNFFFDTDNKSPFDNFIILPSLIIPGNPQDGSRVSKKDILDAWLHGPPDGVHREIPLENVLVLNNYKRLL